MNKIIKPTLKVAHLLDFPDQEFVYASRVELIQMVLNLRAELMQIKTESEIKIASLEEKLAAKNSELENLSKKIST